MTAGAGMRGAGSRGVDGDDAAGGWHDGGVREGRGEEGGEGRGRILDIISICTLLAFDIYRFVPTELTIPQPNVS